MFAGGTFYILPAIFGAAGGGLRLAKTGNSKCPFTVLQDYFGSIYFKIVSLIFITFRRTLLNNT